MTLYLAIGSWVGDCGGDGSLRRPGRSGFRLDPIVE